MAKLKGKEIVRLLESLKNSHLDKKFVRYHIYGVIEEVQGDHSSIDDVIEYIQGYGTADIVHVEVIDEKES